MGLSIISNNTTMKVNRAIASGTTVGAGCYAIVDYQLTAMTTNASLSGNTPGVPTNITRYFGPGQTIPTTFNITVWLAIGSSNFTNTGTMTIQSGVEFINTP